MLTFVHSPSGFGCEYGGWIQHRLDGDGQRIRKLHAYWRMTNIWIPGALVGANRRSRSFLCFSMLCSVLVVQLAEMLPPRDVRSHSTDALSFAQFWVVT